ncbi:N-acetylmuramoyl-L-alanine amidase [Muricauda oceani]|uniref:N-acetylmuramoyl-L-alanine amidase n=1 Tax=Flagellimonas oceani TaxID=2698672 RepID=A0A6G7J6Z7_9FLAO|nr:N-acetylmuramoyl-L-alanine amidase [Allomuricauda oceani]MBW8242556.1 N-acetylmuramoyl-L-alanine amidase [Allomuricauda oceani]QII46314.1 N-acetylmuramoyl-L-alanine amidase [Allomuricauda oceani]
MAQKPIVVIDPGHGGPDSGAVGTNGILEKKVVLDIAKRCLLLNRRLFGDSLEIYLTRYTDTLVPLGTRTRLAKALGADVFVSIHCNQAPNHKAQGFEIFLFHKEVDSESYAVANKLAYYLQSKLGIYDRGVKYANFQVLRDTYGHCPSLLLETGFISNGVEAEFAKKTESQTAIALTILQSLIKTIYYD